MSEEQNTPKAPEGATQPTDAQNLGADLRDLFANAYAMNARMALDAESRPDPSGCIIWTGKINPGGYGEVRFRGTKHAAHRLSYEAANGSAEGLDVHHTCETKACVYVGHLVALTRSEHMSLHRGLELSRADS